MVDLLFLIILNLLTLIAFALRTKKLFDHPIQRIILLELIYIIIIFFVFNE